MNSGSSFANGSKIGITLASLPSSGTAVSITGENSSDFSHVFVPTSSLYSIFNSENNVLKFFVHSQHLWTYTVKDSSIKAQCAVPECVYHSEPVSISLDVSNKFSLNTIISPENASIKFLFWSSSDESIATVENGVIEAKGLGDVVITASAADGSVNISDSVAVSVLGNAVYIH